MTRRLPLLRPLVLALLVPVVAAGEAEAQYDAPPPPAAWALPDVSLVGADGTVTPGVTLVVRNGRIAALGVGVAVPADAKVLEGDSLYVYPGFVDGQADVDVAFPDPSDRAEGEDVLAWSPPRSASGFLPHRRVAHHLAESGDGVADLRRDGIVAGLVHPEGGMAPGQPAVVVLRPEADVPWDLVTRETAGLTMALDPARGVYPSQLFGVIAYLRQAFTDAERYGEIRRSWERSPDRVPTPAWDPDYEALLQAVEADATVWFEADRDEDIRRVLDLADELGFRPALVGGAEAWKLADELAERDVPVLVSLDFPEPDEWDPDADTVEAELDPDARREKEELEATWANAGRLQQAGVRIALTSGRGEADLLEGTRKVVEHGLSEAAALTALTRTPAELFGLRSLGEVREGGPATFTVLRRPLLHEDARVGWTFVEGAPEEGAGSDAAADGAAEEPAADLTGTWDVVLAAQGQEMPSTLRLTQTDDGRLSGTIESGQMGEASVSGTISGRDVTLRIEVPQMPEPFVVEARLAEGGTDRMSGSVDAPIGEMGFTADRRPGASGEGWSRWMDGSGNEEDVR